MVQCKVIIRSKDAKNVFTTRFDRTPIIGERVTFSDGPPGRVSCVTWELNEGMYTADPAVEIRI